MTETIPAGTAVAQVASGALARVKGLEPWTVADLAGLLDLPEPVLDKPVTIGAAPAVKFTPGLREALRAIPGVFGKVTPTEPRKLERAELGDLTAEITAIDALGTELAKRRAAICEIVRIHQDHQAADEGLVNEKTIVVAEGVAKGHKLIATPQNPFRTPVEGYAQDWQQRYVSGGVKISPEDLEHLVEDGEITQREYNAMTRQVRVYDPNRAAEFIRRSPERGLSILRRITRRTPPSASLYPPKK